MNLAAVGAIATVGAAAVASATVVEYECDVLTRMALMPAVKRAAKPAAKPTAKPAATPAATPVAKPAADPVDKTEAKPTSIIGKVGGYFGFGEEYASQIKIPAQYGAGRRI